MSNLGLLTETQLSKVAKVSRNRSSLKECKLHEKVLVLANSNMLIITNSALFEKYKSALEISKCLNDSEPKLYLNSKKMMDLLRFGTLANKHKHVNSDLEAWDFYSTLVFEYPVFKNEKNYKQKLTAYLAYKG